MSKSQKEIITQMQVYIFVAIVLFLFIGMIVGHFAFPSVRWYEYPQKDVIFVEYNGRGIPYFWNESLNIYGLYPGIVYDDEQDQYLFEKGVSTYTYSYPYREGSGLPKIPPIQQKETLSLQEEMEILQEKIKEQEELIKKLKEEFGIIDYANQMNIMFIERTYSDLVTVPDQNYPNSKVIVSLFDVYYGIYDDVCNNIDKFIKIENAKMTFYKVSDVPEFEILNVAYHNVYTIEYGEIIVIDNIESFECD